MLLNPRTTSTWLADVGQQACATSAYCEFPDAAFCLVCNPVPTRCPPSGETDLHSSSGFGRWARAEAPEATWGWSTMPKGPTCDAGSFDWPRSSGDVESSHCEGVGVNIEVWGGAHDRFKGRIPLFVCTLPWHPVGIMAGKMPMRNILAHPLPSSPMRCRACGCG